VFVDSLFVAGLIVGIGVYKAYFQKRTSTDSVQFALNAIRDSSIIHVIGSLNEGVCVCVCLFYTKY